jgi:hypothetical protein
MISVIDLSLRMCPLFVANNASRGHNLIDAGAGRHAT